MGGEGAGGTRNASSPIRVTTWELGLLNRDFGRGHTHHLLDADVRLRLHRFRKHVVSAAFLRCARVVLVADAGILPHERLHRRAADDVARTAVAEHEVVDQRHAPEVQLLRRVQLSQPLHQVGPHDVGVCVDEEVPVVPGPHRVRLLGDVDVLVLVEVPALPGGVAQLVAALLVDEAPFLAAVQVEVRVPLLDLGQHRRQAVVDLAAGDVLLHVAEDERVGQALEHCQQLRRHACEGLRLARLHHQEHVARVREAVAVRVDRRTRSVLAGRLGRMLALVGAAVVVRPAQREQAPRPGREQQDEAAGQEAGEDDGRLPRW